VATITSAQSGDFSDPATWVGGVVPGVGDVAVAATGHVIVIDVDVTVDQVTTTGGTFTFADGVTLTATNATAGVLGAATGIGAVTMSLDAPDSATIIGSVRAGSIASSWGVEFTGTGSLTINGEVRGGTFAGADATGANGVQLTGAGTLTVDNGTDTAVSGGTNTLARGIRCTAAATITITGNITGGSGSNAFGLKTPALPPSPSPATSPAAAAAATRHRPAKHRRLHHHHHGQHYRRLPATPQRPAKHRRFHHHRHGQHHRRHRQRRHQPFGLNNSGSATITVTGNITGGDGSARPAKHRRRHHNRHRQPPALAPCRLRRR
jgi:hypothetical protein